MFQPQLVLDSTQIKHQCLHEGHEGLVSRVLWFQLDKDCGRDNVVGEVVMVVIVTLGWNECWKSWLWNLRNSCAPKATRFQIPDSRRFVDGRLQAT